MTTSTNDNNDGAITGETGGAFADGLTIVRVLLTPVIMFIIYKAWSAKPGDADGFVSLDLKLVLLASVLFAIAAFTDVLDDFLGGSARANERQFGWFDDIADSVLIDGTLIALVWVLGKADLLHWSFAVPVLILVLRDIGLGLTKGYAFSKFGLLETRLGDLKSALAMFATCALVAAPWLTNLVDSFRAGRSDDVAQVYNSASTWVWNTGLVALWIAAILALYTGFKLLTAKVDISEDTAT
ncbi:MAG: hypothetical protein L3J65_06690 [Robiginitomaculum sp.]|nr:hypothetical protein [Robiginitomaculum sp.]